MFIGNFYFSCKDWRPISETPCIHIKSRTSHSVNTINIRGTRVHTFAMHLECVRTVCFSGVWNTKLKRNLIIIIRDSVGRLVILSLRSNVCAMNVLSFSLESMPL